MNSELNTFENISVEKLKNFVEDGSVIILDIRDEQSFKEGHIPDAIHLSNKNIDEVIDRNDPDDNILIYCYKGISSQNAAQHFCNLGFKNVFSLIGGYAEFIDNTE